ncbi:hypothetical protein C0580_00905 [Candidatus Parcubacteria bacterium]|nr:MAG: hypothetical protein C0580_00905 [Candidatus Parcubacteria bacterium]
MEHGVSQRIHGVPQSLFAVSGIGGQFFQVFKTRNYGGQYAPESGVQFAPESLAHYHPKRVAQFGAKSPGCKVSINNNGF